MEPMDPEVKTQILENAPQAEPEDVNEYERLLSERFTMDPDIPAPAAEPETLRGVLEKRNMTREEIDQRLAELQEKLFGEAK